MTEPKMIQWLKGETKLKPIEYKIEEVVTGPWYWRKREYYIVWEFGRLGVFKSYYEANMIIEMYLR